MNIARKYFQTNILLKITQNWLVYKNVIKYFLRKQYIDTNVDIALKDFLKTCFFNVEFSYVCEYCKEMFSKKLSLGKHHKWFDHLILLENIFKQTFLEKSQKMVSPDL